MKSIKDLLSDHNITGPGEKLGGYKAFAPNADHEDPDDIDLEEYDDDDDAFMAELRLTEASIHNIYKKKSPNQKMNYSVLRAVRALKEAESLLSECCHLKTQLGMSNRDQFWSVSSQKHREAMDIIKRCGSYLRDLEA